MKKICLFALFSCSQRLALVMFPVPEEMIRSHAKNLFLIFLCLHDMTNLCMILTCMLLGFHL